MSVPMRVLFVYTTVAFGVTKSSEVEVLAEDKVRELMNETSNVTTAGENVTPAARLHPDEVRVAVLPDGDAEMERMPHEEVALSFAEPGSKESARKRSADADVKSADADESAEAWKPTASPSGAERARNARIIAIVTMVLAVLLVLVGVWTGTATRHNAIVWGTLAVTSAVFVGLAMHLESFTLLESLYLITQIITTVGYGDCEIKTSAMQWVMSVYIIVAVPSLVTAVLDFVGNLQVDHVVDQIWRRVAQAKSRSAARSEQGHEVRAASVRVAISAATYVFFLLYGMVFFGYADPCHCIGSGCDPENCAATGGTPRTWTGAFYMSVVTLATVGIGDLTAGTPSGQLFAIPWIFFGVTAMANLGSSVNTLWDVQARQERGAMVVSDKVFKKLDRDKSGNLDELEFQIYALMKFGIVSEEDMESVGILFRAIDKDNSGTLSFDEIKEYCEDGFETSGPEVKLQEGQAQE